MVKKVCLQWYKNIQILLIEDLNMYVIEIPGCPEQGIDPETFEKTILSNRITACLLNSNQFCSAFLDKFLQYHSYVVPVV